MLAMSVQLSTFALLVVFLSLSKYTSCSFLSRGFHQKKTTDSVELYVVYLGALPQGFTSEKTVTSHLQLLSSLKGSEEVARSSLVVSYSKSFNGFAAMLSQQEADALKGMPGVVSVFPNQVKKLLTTRSWDFLGLTSSATRNTTVESEIIVGVLDTGVWPESKMFDDTSVGPIPSRWKGECQTGDQFTAQNCNKKLIGAKYFYKGYLNQFGSVNRSLDYLSPRDAHGHGTHTSSIATGSPVQGASLYGIAQGIARGGVPSARLAIYKICWDPGFCADVDILSAFDHAISDGVDLISISLGGELLTPSPYNLDSVAIGSFHATYKGIAVSCAAGNIAQFPIANVAPWVLTVAASSIDRKFYAPILLGNNVTIQGASINTFQMNDTWYPLISGAQGVFANSTSDRSYCDQGSLDEAKVKGKIVYCEIGGNTSIEVSVLETRGAGLIFAGPGLDALSFLHWLPESVLGQSNGDKVVEYINSTSSPVAKILPSQTVLGQLPAPLTSYFSSRGPNHISWDILKPDISAPGENILAAWSLNNSISENNEYDDRFMPYNIVSGTSVATAHATGAIAYVKSFHPNWSPAALKSAIMTTAIPFDRTNPFNSDLEFGYGAGEINPTKAIDPGLIYDVENHDYIMFLCTRGYNSTEVMTITGESNVQCPNTTMPFSLNYPAISTGIPIYMKKDWYIVTRTLTNVGVLENMTYRAMLVVPEGMEVDISPKVLSFSKAYEKQSFEVKMRAPAIGQSTNMLSASLTWVSKTYSVRTPIVIWVAND